ncbi:hypothetical protein ABW20_dc0104625 [Dactylellina cionopaga]|nr:hypothetical protein ABW20_dc0104625 [Dactylellina cionopaga]
MMLQAKVFLTVLFAAQVHATGLDPSACYADNCLRALRGLASQSYARVSSDCAGYVWTTVNPLPTTVTETVTTPIVETSVVLIPYTTTQETSSGTSVATSYTTITTTTYAKVTISVRPINTAADPGVTARNVLPRDTAPLPTYATGCTSGARYASACSCFGVPASAATAAGPPVSTVTVTTETDTTTTLTTSQLVATTFITVPAASSTTVISSTSVAAVEATYVAFGLKDAQVADRYVNNLNWGYWTFASEQNAWGVFIQTPNEGVYLPIFPSDPYVWCDLGAYDVDNAAYYVNGAAYIRTEGSESCLDGPNYPREQEVVCNWDDNGAINCHCDINGQTYTEFLSGPDGLIQLAKSDYVPRTEPLETWLDVQVTNVTIQDGINNWNPDSAHCVTRVP